MQIQYGELKINFSKTDMDNLINLKNSLTHSEKIGVGLGTIAVTITGLVCATSIILKALDIKKIEDNSEMDSHIEIENKKENE